MTLGLGHWVVGQIRTLVGHLVVGQGRVVGQVDTWVRTLAMGSRPCQR